MTTQSIRSTEERSAPRERSTPPGLRGWPKFWIYLILAALSILNSSWILSEAGVTFSRCFAFNDTHRRQAAALLDGHFWLSKSIYDTQFDNCYVNGKVQQVWGLGVPMYLIPFELFGRAIGISPFPDRIAMGVMLAAFFFYCGTLLTALPGRGFTALQAAGIVVLIAFSPPLLNLLLNGPQNVYEDASVYGLLTSLGIFVAMLRFIARRRMRDYWICCLLGGMSGLVRPTHAIYGLLGPAICRIPLFRAFRIRSAVVPLSLVFAGMAFLAASNRIRFGAFTEFGHRETFTSARGEMTSRFVNPILGEPAGIAAKELFGALFLAPHDIRQLDSFGQHLFPGQADCFRWRDFYVTSYDPTLLAIIVGGMTAGLWQLWSRTLPTQRRRQPAVSSQFIISLLAWGFVSAGALFIFMLHYPGLSARYLYDFWPGFLPFLVIIWLPLHRHHPYVAQIILISWLSFQFYLMDCRDDPLPPVGRPAARRPDFGRPARRLQTAGFYDVSHLPEERLTHFCDFRSGKAGFEIRIPIDAPAYVELIVEPRMCTDPDAWREDEYRARIATSELRLLSVMPEIDTPWIRVTFAVPAAVAMRSNDELLFICFASSGDELEQNSERRIRAVRWR